jgi:hypothetical protein
VRIFLYLCGGIVNLLKIMKKIFTILVAGMMTLAATAQTTIDTVITPKVVDVDTLTVVEEPTAVVEIAEEIVEEVAETVIELIDTLVVEDTTPVLAVIPDTLISVDTTAVVTPIDTIILDTTNLPVQALPIVDSSLVVTDTMSVVSDSTAKVVKDTVVITDTIIVVQKLPTPIVTPRAANKPQRPTYSAAKPSMYVDLGLPSGTLWKSYNEPYIYTYEQATKLFGGSMPTEAQMVELQEECIWQWNGSGYRVTGPNGEVITMPAGGYTECEEAIYPNNAIYWVNSVDSEYPGPSRFTITPVESYFDCPDPANLKCTYYSVRLVK